MVHVVSVLAIESLVRTRQNCHFFNILPSIKKSFADPLLSKPEIKVVVLLVRQLRHGFPKKAKVSPNLTVAHNNYTGLEILFFWW